MTATPSAAPIPPPGRMKVGWIVAGLVILLGLLTWLAIPRKEITDPGIIAPTAIVNRDYCESSYPTPTKEEVDSGRIELTVQSGCGLQLFHIPWHSWHPQWGKTRPGQTGMRWIAYQYRGWDVAGPFFPSQSLDVAVAPSRDIFLEGDDNDTVVFVRVD